MNMPEETVKVRMWWNDSRNIATCRLGDLEDVRWETDSPGVVARNTYPPALLHANVSCDAIVTGKLAHDCGPGEGPHLVKVCIVQKGNRESVIQSLRDAAGPRPTEAKMQ